MIVQCPKCKTCFEVPDGIVAEHGEMKFQCAECAYVWTESLKKNDVKPFYPEEKSSGESLSVFAKNTEGAENSVKSENGEGVSTTTTVNVVENMNDRKLPSLLERGDDEEENAKKSGRKSLMDMLGLSHDSVAKWVRISLCVLAVGVVVFIGMLSYSYFIGGESAARGMLASISGKKANEKKLYIEIAKPITLVREGANEYLIILDTDSKACPYINPAYSEDITPKLKGVK